MNVNGGYSQGVFTAEQCDYSVTGTQIGGAIIDEFNVCCTNCQRDYTRSTLKSLLLKFSFSEETFIDYSGTITKRNLDTSKQW